MRSASLTSVELAALTRCSPGDSSRLLRFVFATQAVWLYESDDKLPVCAARERNWLSMVKMTSTLSAVSFALLIRFQFGDRVDMPVYEQQAQEPVRDNVS